MKKILLSSAIVMSLMTGFAHAETTSIPTDFSNLTNEQKDQLGKVVSDYLVQHPEFLVQASQNLQVQRQKEEANSRIKAAADAVNLKEQLLNDPNTPAVGSKDSKVAVISFTDYNCVFCAKASPEISALVKANPNVKFVFKEYPIFAERFPTSLHGAQVGEKIFKEKGADAYFKFHEGVYATGHNEGSLTMAEIDKIAKDLGVDPTVPADYSRDYINSTLNLAKSLNIQGTPGFIVMKTDKPTPESTAVIVGYAPKDALQKVIDEVSK